MGATHARPVHPFRGPGATLRIAVGLLWALAVGSITLYPEGVEGSATEIVVDMCLICGSRGLGDAILNLVLFMPLGILIGLRWSPRRALVLGLVASCGIEVAQLYIGGRYTHLGDLFWNMLGSGLGAAVAIKLRRWLAAPPENAIPQVIAVGLPVLYLSLSGILLTPASTSHPYFGQWRPDLGSMPQYEGHVLSATLDGVPIPRGIYVDQSEPRLALANDWTIEATIVKGTPPSAVSPIVSIYDGARQEIALLGAHGEDLVLRERTLGDVFRLDRPDLRWPRALAGTGTGTEIVVTAARRGDDRCLKVGDAARCGLGISPGETWSLLLFLEGASPAQRALVSTAWMATLFFLTGLLSGPAVATARATVVGALLVITITAASRLAVPTPIEWIGMLAGVFVGFLTKPVARTFLGAKLSSRGNQPASSSQ